MNDDVKAAVERARSREDDARFTAALAASAPITVLRRDDLDALLAHIDGEPARIAAACEEQRAADVARSRKAKYALTGGKTSLAGAWNAGIASAIEGVESMPLTATPLADEIAALRARVAELERQREGMLMGGVTVEARQQLERAEKAEAERDEAQRGEQEAWRQTDQMRAERDAKHQLAAAEATALARAEADLRDMVAERDDERDQRIVAEVDRDRAHGAREVLGKLLVERDALRAQVEALERERDMLQTALRDNSAAHSETGKMLLRAEAERDALKLEVESLARDMVAMTATANAEVAAGLAIAAERDALRARVDALYGVTLFAHAFAEAEPLVSGYVRLHGHILHLREIHALARAATQAMDEAKP